MPSPHLTRIGGLSIASFGRKVALREDDTPT